ncbi:MAG: DUF559 domain-containing protein [Actinobacteria bacterium]|nr:DUF559 domain-containing protein [Actinomycetota bacterium]
MGYPTRQSRLRAGRLARNQHGVISRAQLLELGLSGRAIKHRVTTGRLYSVHRGVYAVGRRELNRRGRWMAAVLSAGEGAVLSHRSAGELWGILPRGTGPPQLSVPGSNGRRRRDVVVHRRPSLRPEDVTRRERIPVTVPACTLVDLAAEASRDGRGRALLERAVNEADRLGLIDPERLREAVGEMPRRPGLGMLRGLLDVRTFVLTDSELERRLLPMARGAGLGLPETGARVNGYRVDFLWPEIGLVVETDGLRYHRTPAQQARDRERDQAHAEAGLTPLRFTHSQVRFEPERVKRTLREVAARLRGT